MDRYKKKNMKFMGRGPEVRAAQMNAERRSVRQQRFSLQRPLEDVDHQSTNQKKVQNLASKVPTLGIPSQSRLEMLNKWKAEKEIKKRLEMNSKKPVFKVGPSRPQLDAMASSRLQESKTESFSSKVLTPNRSISKALKASRIQPVSKLADITHHKNISSRPAPDAKATVKTVQTRSNINSRPDADAKATIKTVQSRSNINSRPDADAKATIKTVQSRSIPSSKPQIARLQVNEAKIASTTKPQIGKPQATKVMNALPTKSVTMHPQPRQNLAKISNSKPVAGKSAITKEEKKIPTTGIKPPTLPPLRRAQFQNQQNKSKPVPSVQSKRAVAKAVETTLNREPEVKPTGSSLDQSSSLLSCPLSAIEVSAKEMSFAPADFVFCPPKIRSSWLDDEGPCTILSRVMKEMNLKPRTSTPIKKELVEHQELESSCNKEDAVDTGESSSDAKKEYSTTPNADGLSSSSSAKHSELENDVKAALTFSIEDKAEDSKSLAVVVSSAEGLDISSVNKEMGDLALSEKENREPVSDVEKQELETPLEKEANLCVASENFELCDESKHCDVKELADVSSVAGNKDQNVIKEAEISVFYPSELAAVAPQKSKRFFSSCWKMEKPSLALISESPENFKDVPRTPKSHRRKGLLTEEFTPRRSQRLARKSELKEENIFEVKECFLDSPSVEAATRMSMRQYDFDGLHLEASALQGNLNGTHSTRSNRGKVSLLYTPPRQRASTRNKSLKGDLMTFSPNVE